jgi:hypothetical protein
VHYHSQQTVLLRLLLLLLLQMAQLEAEVAAKQQQLQQLAAENVSLTAKARVLDQLVASAGGSGGTVRPVYVVCHKVIMICQPLRRSVSAA